MTEGPDRERGHSEYYFRRPLGPSELVPAVAIGLGAGLMAFYVAAQLSQRTPLMREETVPAPGDDGRIVRRPRRRAGG